VVKATDPAKASKRGAHPNEAIATSPASTDRKSAIITIRSRKQAKHADVPDLTEEELQRRDAAADALFRDMKRRIASKR
jgi:hypothetical protein